MTDINITVTVDTGGLDAMIAGLDQAQGVSPPGPIRDLYTKWGRRVQAFNEERFDRFSIGGGDWAPLALRTIQARQKQRLAGTKGSLERFNQQFGGSGKDSTGARGSLARNTARGGLLVSAGRTVSILKDTNVLRDALKIGFPGSTFDLIPAGFVYGVAGNAPHPPRPTSGTSVAAAIAVVSGRAVGRTAPRKRGGGGGSRSVPTIGQIAGFHQEGGPHLPKREIIVPPDQEVVDDMSGDAVQAVLRLAGGTGL